MVKYLAERRFIKLIFGFVRVDQFLGFASQDGEFSSMRSSLPSFCLTFVDYWSCFVVSLRVVGYPRYLLRGLYLK
jgi:hypothetical protein